MINLINETLIHPHINTKWHVIGFEKGMLECVSEDSAKVEYITKEFGLEIYAEQQKQRADELENDLKVYKVLANGWQTTSMNNKKHANELEKRWSELWNFLIDGENMYLVDLTRDEVIRKMHDLEENNNA